jgi:hypothetical protein
MPGVSYLEETGNEKAVAMAMACTGWRGRRHETVLGVWAARATQNYRRIIWSFKRDAIRCYLARSTLTKNGHFPHIPTAVVFEEIFKIKQ